MTSSSIKMLLVGDYSIFRSALKLFLETEHRIKVVGEASEADKAAEIIAAEKPDLILVDLPDDGGKHLLPFLRTVSVPVLILVGQRNAEVYQSCLMMGISGLIQKQESGSTLFKAIDKVHQGEIWFDRAVMGETIRRLLDEKQSQRNRPTTHIANALTSREMEVVELICKGMKNKIIAEKLFITETTVRHHLTSVFNKFDISSRLELVVYAFKNDLVQTPEKYGSYKGSNSLDGGHISSL